MNAQEHFDVVIVGSGFGGSVMAYRLAEAGLSVCVLERGKRYPPGSFPRSPRGMRDNFWDPNSGRQGLFQVWSFGGVDGLVSAGLGGGSLIYANVLIRKDARWFVQRQPDGSSTDWPLTRADLDPHYDNVEAMLAPQRFPFDRAPYDSTPKTVAFQAAAERAGLDWSLPLLAVTFGDPADCPVPGEPIRGADGRTTDNLHGRTRSTCRLCGECDIGCNYGSKNTLDYNYLAEADRLGAQLRDHAEVKSFEPKAGGGYSIRYVVHVDQDGEVPTPQSAQPEVTVTADRLVLSAGTFGTTYLMLKNRDRLPHVSDRLGHYFSGNGDFLGLVHDAHRTVGGVRTSRPMDPSRGSVITSTVRVPDTEDGGDGPGFYLQDGGYPGFVDWLAEASNELGLLRRALKFAEERVLSRLRHSDQPDIDEEIEGLIGDAHRSSSLLPLLGMGMDMPNGTMSLNRDGRLALDWNADRSAEYFRRVISTMGTIATELDAELQVDPLWYLRRKVITVHPVGGCSMGRDDSEGVVDDNGEVFGCPGLFIADGSVMPGPVGPNPSFTIAALADRFADRLLATRTR